MNLQKTLWGLCCFGWVALLNASPKEHRASFSLNEHFTSDAECKLSQDPKLSKEHSFQVSTGAFSFHRTPQRTIEFGMEYKGHLFWQPSPCVTLRPLVGVMSNLRGGGYLYSGLNFEFLACKYLLIGPGFAAGYYWQGNSKPLGYPIEFRTGVELGWRLLDGRRFGIHFYHLSNAGLGKKNPGEESLVFYYEIPFNL